MKKIKQFLIDLKEIFLGERFEEKDLAEQADKVVDILTTSFDVNQQSEMVKLIRIKLIEKREQDIVKAEENVEMLKEDLNKLKTIATQ